MWKVCVCKIAGNEIRVVEEFYNTKTAKLNDFNLNNYLRVIQTEVSILVLITPQLLKGQL